jgi:hypothetical protein
MSLRDEFARRYSKKATHVSILPDYVEVPWSQLTVGEYLDISRDIDKSDEEKEEDIFKKKVTDEFLVNNIEELKAGTVTTVSNSILEYSIPESPEEYEGVLNYFRVQIHESILDQLIIYISNAFPSYTPDEIRDMNIEKFMYTVALAESKMLQLQAVDHPISFTQGEQKNGLQEKAREKEKIDVKRLKDMFDQSYSEPPQQASVPQPQPQIPQPSSEQKFVVKKDDVLEAVAGLDGFERQNYELFSAKMVEETAPIYSDYFNKIKENGKIVPDDIKSFEERVKEQREREIKNKKLYEQQQIEKAKQVQQEDRRGDLLFEEALGRKGKKKRKKNRR